MIERLQQQKTEWVDVERPAQAGDRATLDFEGSIDGDEYEFPRSLND